MTSFSSDVHRSPFDEEGAQTVGQRHSKLEGPARDDAGDCDSKSDGHERPATGGEEQQDRDVQPQDHGVGDADRRDVKGARGHGRGEDEEAGSAATVFIMRTVIILATMMTRTSL